jgi:Secretion system C-terminal sorting domain
MKNFTLIALCAMLFSTGSLFAQPMAAPTAPTQAAGDVVSILSNTYTPLAANFTPKVPAEGINFFPNWGQTTTFAEFPINGNPIKQYTALTYQGIDFGGNINASGMTTLHWDIYTDVATTLRISLISNGTGERFVTRTTAVGWNSYDIPLTEYTSQSGFSVSSIFQFKFEEFPRALGAGTKTVYLYNLYFWKPANVPTITGFSVPAKLTTDAPFALTAPMSNSSGAFTYTSDNPSVATVSGNMVTIVGVGTSTITANQAAAGAFAAGSTSAVLIVSYAPPATVASTPPARTATDVKSVYSNAYTPIPGATDFYPYWGQSTPVGFTDFTIGADNIKGYKTLSYQGTQFASAIDVSTFQFLHIDLWTPNCAAFDLYLIGGTEQKVTLTPALTGWNSYDIPLAAYNSPTLTLDAIIQLKFVATAIPTSIPVGSSSTVYVDNIYFYKGSVVTPTAAAPTPASPPSNVISMFSGTYTNKPIDTWQTSWSAGNSVLTDLQIGGNDVKKYVLKNFVGVEFTGAKLINAAAATTMHIDVWTPLPIAAGGLKFKLVDVGVNGNFGRSSAGDDTEGEISAPAIAGGEWVGLDIPFANFVAAGLTNRAHLAQFIPSSSTPVVVFMDNIYFFASTPLAVELTNLTAKSVNKTTVLTWQTSSEKDNQGFTVERSLNGTDYVAIGQVKGFGTTNTVHNYVFTDATPTTGVNYYRLRQADFNGKETLSKVVSVISGKNFLVLKNTLVQDLLDVTVGEETNSPLSIFNVSGQLVYSAKVQGNQLLDVSALTSGLYIVRMETGDMSRFVKQ